jgi:hypothetical protein
MLLPFSVIKTLNNFNILLLGVEKIINIAKIHVYFEIPPMKTNKKFIINIYLTNQPGLNRG